MTKRNSVSEPNVSASPDPDQVRAQVDKSLRAACSRDPSVCADSCASVSSIPSMKKPASSKSN